MPNILVVNNGSIYLNHLLKLIDEDVTVTSWRSDPADWHQYDLVIFSATSYLPVIWSEFLVHKQQQFIASTDVPVIGICFGFCLIAKAFGAGPQFAPVPRVGTYCTWATKQRHPMFAGVSTEFKATYNHFYRTFEPSPDLNVLARCKDNTIAAVEHKTKPIIGFQFHPESHKRELETDRVFDNAVRYLLNRSTEAL